MVYVIAELGINHNGDLDIAKRLIDVAIEAGADAVKFQKRDIDTVYGKDYLDEPRASPWGNTQRDQKEALEFGEREYKEINLYCRSKGIDWSASCWDELSVDFIDQFDPPWYKVASASLTDDRLLKHTRSKGKPVFLSTGMSTMDQINHAVQVLGKHELVLMHTTSTYPCDDRELNLRCIQTLKNKFDISVGYSGHERGIATTVAAVALGAEIVERHITLDRTMYGSDQSASLEPEGFKRLVKYIRTIERSLGDGVKRIFNSEVPVMEKLRRI